MPSLRLKRPDGKGEITYILVGPRITLGRKANNTIQIADSTVSAQHAEFINVDGHYRLHDLESLNLTRVNGNPITDFHLAEACQLHFGTVECAFSLEAPQAGEIVPTRDELEFLRRENADLVLKMGALQKQIGILSSARLMFNETTEIGLTPNALRKLTRECGLLREENVTLKLEMESLRVDLSTLTRDRNATRQGWETVKAELERRQQKTAAQEGPLARIPGVALVRAESPTPPVNAAPLVEPPADREPAVELKPAVEIEPAMEPASSAEPAMEPPMAGEPATEPLVNTEPAIEPPVSAEPAIEPLVNAEPAIEPLVNTEPAIEPLVVTEPAIEPLVNAEPTIEPLVSTEPATEPPVNVEAAFESPVNTEPATEPPLNAEAAPPAAATERNLSDETATGQPIDPEPAPEPVSPEPAIESPVSVDHATEPNATAEAPAEPIVSDEPAGEPAGLENEAPPEPAIPVLPAAGAQGENGTVSSNARDPQAVRSAVSRPPRRLVHKTPEEHP